MSTEGDRASVLVVLDVGIREAVRSDLPAILDLYAQDELSTSPKPTELTPIVEAFEAIASDAKASLFVAMESERVVGTFQMNVLRHLTQGGAPVAQIEAVAVAQASRGRGVGSAMMRFAIEEARRIGCVRVQLTSQKRRTRAHGFYEKLGFARTHEGMKLKL